LTDALASAVAEPLVPGAELPACILADSLTAYFGETAAIRDVSIAFADRTVTAIIGPSGCGKSTLLRCLNRMHETVPGTRVTGSVRLFGTEIYSDLTSPTALRRHIGMVFQRPTPFPTMSIRKNVAAGLRVSARTDLADLRFDDIVEEALHRAALWEEVKDRLDRSAMELSGGQQQRLSLALALVGRPALVAR